MPACLFTLKRVVIDACGISAYNTRPYRLTHRDLPVYISVYIRCLKPTYKHKKSDYLFR